VEELLHETILLIGYYALHNENSSKIIIKSENPIVVKLCGLPINYFKEKRLTDILFPTLIILARNESILSILDNEISLE